MFRQDNSFYFVADFDVEFVAVDEEFTDDEFFQVLHFEYRWAI